jgi:hypothetical protein
LNGFRSTAVPAAALRPLMRVLSYGLAASCVLGVLSGCSRSRPAPDPRADDSLRVFMGVKSLTAKLQIPAGEDYFSFHVLNFQDGKLVDDAMCMPSKLVAGNSREMSLELLWGEQRGETVVTLFVSSQDAHGWSRQSGRTAEYWRLFDRASAQTVSPSKPVEHLGYKILAFVQGGGSQRPAASTSFEEAILHQPYVGAIAVKTYASQEALDKAKVARSDRGRTRY